MAGFTTLVRPYLCGAVSSKRKGTTGRGCGFHRGSLHRTLYFTLLKSDKNGEPIDPVPYLINADQQFSISEEGVCTVSAIDLVKKDQILIPIDLREIFNSN
jgi:hypothetical protein